MVHSLDGVIQSSDKATILNDASTLSGTYSLTPNAGSAVKANVTITNLAPTAIAYRLFDRGTLTTNQNLTVTVVVKNTVLSGSIQNVTVDDNWWQNFPSVFQLVTGSYNLNIPIITAGANATESYVLRMVSASSEQFLVPAATANYQYLLSSTSYRSEATLSQAVLQINNLGPAIVVVAHSSISSGTPLGTPGNFTLLVTNSGNSPALAIKVGRLSLENLPQGNSHTFNVPISLSNLLQRNFTKTFSLEFTNSAGVTQNVTTNSVSLVLSHSGMVLPLIQLSTNDTLTSRSLATRTLNVTYTYANKGTGASGVVTGTETLPPGVSCKVANGNATCAAGTYTMTVPELTTQNTQINELTLSFTQDNFIIPPAAITTSYEGATLHSFGGAYVVPAGIALTKTFSLQAGFPDMTSLVTIGVTNAGSNPVYNATLSSSQDAFDFIASGATTTKTYATPRVQAERELQLHCHALQRSLGELFFVARVGPAGSRGAHDQLLFRTRVRPSLQAGHRGGGHFAVYA